MTLLLTLAPGPDTMFVLGASLSNGARGGLLAAAGTMTGLLVHLALVVAGASALIAASPLAFDVLRWGGAAYLIWIGVPLLVRACRDRRDAPAPASRPMSARVYWQGLATNVLNPKVAVFYVAFLPHDTPAPSARIEPLGDGPSLSRRRRAGERPLPAGSAARPASAACSTVSRGWSSWDSRCAWRWSDASRRSSLLSRFAAGAPR